MRKLQKVMSLFLAVIMLVLNLVPMVFAASSTVSFDYSRCEAAWDTGWYDDEFMIHLAFTNTADVYNYGVFLYDSNGNSIDGFDTLHKDLIVPIPPGTWRALFGINSIMPNGDRMGELREGETYYWQGYVVCEGMTYWTREFSFTYSTDGARYAEYTLLDKNGKFKYHSNITNETEQYFYSYNEKWFTRDSTEYNHELGQMSIRVALAAAQKSSKNITALFDDLDFDYTSTSVQYPTPTKETIGYAIGGKRIADDEGGSALLVAVAVRGGGYKQEWASNFSIGTTSEHAGFAKAASKVSAAIQDFIAKNKKSGEKVKIWITGYSRGAATANITAQRLTALAKRGGISGLTTNDVYAYCFECPRTVRTDDPAYRGDTYSNIFNIVNYVDVVTKVAPEAWKFDRYGITYYLPASELTTSYSRAEMDMEDEYTNIIDWTRYSGNSYVKTYELTTTMPGQGKFTDDAVDALASFFKSQSVYANGHEDTLSSLLATFNGDAYEAGTVLSLIVQGLPAFPILHPNITAKITRNLKELGSAHYGELCLAWMDALEGQSSYANKRTRYLYVNCPVNVSIYSSGLLVAQIMDDEVQELGDDAIPAYIDEDGQKVFVLPCDAEFDIEIEATDVGGMTYTITEYDVDSAQTVKTTSYQMLSIEPGMTFVGKAPEMQAEAHATYALSSEDEDLIPTVEQTGDEVQSFSVTATSAGRGTVSGGGSYVCGEYAKVTAQPMAYGVFDGWFINGDLVSTDPEYRFLVSCDTEVIGRFSNDDSLCSVTYSDGVSDEQVFADQNYVVEIGTDTPSFVGEPIRSGYTFAGWSPAVAEVVTSGVVYTAIWVKDTDDDGGACSKDHACPIYEFSDMNTDAWYHDGVHFCIENGLMQGVSDGVFDPSGTTTRAMLVTLLWRLEGEPVVNYLLSFGDVEAERWYTEAIRWAASEKIVEGYDNGMFGINDAITREQLVTIMWRYAQYKGYDVSNGESVGDLTFEDGSTVSKWARSAMQWGYGYGLIAGVGSGNVLKLKPQDMATRAQVATVIHRFCENAIVE